MTARNDILQQLAKEKVAYLRLCFSDIMGQNKNVEVPSSQFGKALDGEIMFDGSSIQGFSRIEESDMLLMPDLSTFQVFPWDGSHGKVARIICDVRHPDGSDFAGCPRTVLKRVCEKAKKMGYIMNVGPEAEFFLFEQGPKGEPTTFTNDAGGYFDLTPIDRGEDTRRAIVEVLERIGFEVEAAHHEVAVAQHEVDFKYDEVIRTADNVITFRFIVRKIAADYNLHATFMPKPVFGISGSGMHANQSLFSLNGENIFYDPKAEYQLSDVCLHYIAGLIKHAEGYCAITNPLVNSYKRLVPGFEAPTHIAWSEKNRSPLIRVPARRGSGTRVELRMPDPSCNPYLAFAVMLASGLEGMEQKLNPGAPVSKNIFHLDEKEREALNIKSLPTNLSDAIDCMERDSLMKEVLGDHIYHQYVNAKRQEWHEYIAQVHQWEVDQYLTKY